MESNLKAIDAGFDLENEDDDDEEAPEVENSMHVLTYSLGSDVVEEVPVAKKSTEPRRSLSRLSNPPESPVFEPKEFTEPTRLGCQLSGTSRIMNFSSTDI